MLIAADKERCIGAGQCLAIAPDVFDQDDDGIVEVVAGEPDPDLEDSARRAARACPVRAIEFR
jgi:ferredoxin